MLDPNFKPPTVLKASLGFDRELPWWGLVFSADYALAPGLVLAGDVSWFDNDATEDTDTGDKGWAAVGSFRLAF